jgi:hypothetical protein
MTILAMLLAAAFVWQEADKRTTVRLFVFTVADTTAGAAQSDEAKGRLDAVREMREALERKKGITIVADRAEANVTMEVVGREQREEPGGAFGGKSITRMGDTIIRLRVKAGDEESDIKGMGQGTWGRAAKDAADRFVKWVARREPKRSAVGKRWLAPKVPATS